MSYFRSEWPNTRPVSDPRWEKWSAWVMAALRSGSKTTAELVVAYEVHAGCNPKYAKNYQEVASFHNCVAYLEEIGLVRAKIVERSSEVLPGDTAARAGAVWRFSLVNWAPSTNPTNIS